MTAPDSRYLDEAMARLAEAVAQPVGGSIVISTADACAIGNELRRLQALARGPQQAGGEDVIRGLAGIAHSHRHLSAAPIKAIELIAALQAEVARLTRESDGYRQSRNAYEEDVVRLQAALREAGRDAEYARLWRNRWVSDRTAYWQPTAGNYESARIRAEAEAADYEQTFDAARERLRDAALNGGQDDG